MKACLTLEVFSSVKFSVVHLHVEFWLEIWLDYPFEQNRNGLSVPVIHLSGPKEMCGYLNIRRVICQKLHAGDFPRQLLIKACQSGIACTSGADLRFRSHRVAVF